MLSRRGVSHNTDGIVHAFLQNAVRDLLYLKERNDELELKLKKAAKWELDVR